MVNSRLKTVIAAALIGTSLFAAGCKKYDVPEFVEIEPNESGFLIKMVGDSKDQAKFDSVEFLEENKVAAKRVQIPHTWIKTGRMYWTGEYQDTVRLIKVDRTPVTREWTASNSQGAPGTNKAIWVESKDSVSLSIDLVCTAMILEEDCAQFLYRYTSKSLTEVMDKEIRGRIQQELAEECAKHQLEQLKQNKGEILAKVRPLVVAFFKERGIELTSLGFGGGLTYENTGIQNAINKTFEDQQLKISALAKYDAQVQENETIKAKAQAEAEAAKSRASGEAEAIKLLADAKAYEIEKAKATGNMYILLRQLEIQNETLKRWDGKLPVYNMGTGDNIPSLLMQVPNMEPVK
jgi:regulator of protease activity HflC (stomatin/prohibitin superfamily)